MTQQVVIENKDRLVTYNPVNSNGPFYIDFPLFDPTGADLDVRLDDIKVDGWAFYGTPVKGFFGTPNTWINGYITFENRISGKLTIEGERDPHRQDCFVEGRGIPARDMDAAFNTVVAVQREHAQKLRRALTLPASSNVDARSLLASVSRVALSVDNIDLLAQYTSDISLIGTFVVPNINDILSAKSLAEQAKQSALEAEVQANLAQSYANLVGGQFYDFGTLSDDVVGEDDWGIL